MVIGDKGAGGVRAAAVGLFCSVGRNVLCRDEDRDAWQIALPSEVEAFDLDPLAHPQPSPDGKHGAHVVVSGTERHVCIASLPGPVVRTLPTALSRVAGMSWSPGGKWLCVVAEDPSVGVLSMDGSRPQQALPVFSLFMVGNDDPDLLPVAGPIALPGIPRWSPAGDAVAVVGFEHGGAQVALVVTTDGREGSFVSGERVILGASAWTASGSLLCAVAQHRDGVHIQLVNTATGESTELGEPWEDVCWLSLVGERVLVAGKSDGAWCVADVTGGARMVLTASFARIAEVAATPEFLWVVAPVESGELGLWSMDLRGEHLRLHAAAASVRGLEMRLDGRTVAFMAGPVGAESVHVTTVDDQEVLEIGRRDMIMGWIDAHMPYGRLPRLHYLLTPTYQAVDDWAAPSAPGDDETGTIAMTDAPEPLMVSAPLQPEAEEQHLRSRSDGAQEEVLPAEDEVATGSSRASNRQSGGGLRRQRLAEAAFIVVTAVLVLALAIPAARKVGLFVKGTPAVDTPSTPSANVPGNDVVVTPSDVAVTPETPSTPAGPVEPVPVESPVIETYGVKPGLWVAATERVRVRSAAGTDHAILGYLLTTERARVLAGPTIIETVPWWNVRCYDTAAQPTLTGWISGDYLRPSTAPVAPPAVTPPTPVKPVTPAPVVKPTTGTVILNSNPAGARVVVNGTERGVTPLSLVLPGKDVYISLTHDGYMDYTTTLTVKAGTTVDLTFPLIPLSPGG